jgi:hypothetical protein
MKSCCCLGDDAQESWPAATPPRHTLSGHTESSMQAALLLIASYRDSSEAGGVLIHVQSRDAVHGVDGVDLLLHNLNSADAGTYPDIFHATTLRPTARLRAMHRDGDSDEGDCSKDKKESLTLLT